jgi:hypothetical protein
MAKVKSTLGIAVLLLLALPSCTKDDSKSKDDGDNNGESGAPDGSGRSKATLNLDGIVALGLTNDALALQGSSGSGGELVAVNGEGAVKSAWVEGTKPDGSIRTVVTGGGKVYVIFAERTTIDSAPTTTDSQSSSSGSSSASSSSELHLKEYGPNDPVPAPTTTCLLAEVAADRTLSCVDEQFNNFNHKGVAVKVAATGALYYKGYMASENGSAEVLKKKEDGKEAVKLNVETDGLNQFEALADGSLGYLINDDKGDTALYLVSNAGAETKVTAEDAGIGWFKQLSDGNLYYETGLTIKKYDVKTKSITELNTIDGPEGSTRYKKDLGQFEINGALYTIYGGTAGAGGAIRKIGTEVENIEVDNMVAAAAYDKGLILAMEDGSVVQRDAASGEETKLVEGLEGVEELAVDKNGRLVVSTINKTLVIDLKTKAVKESDVKVQGIQSL